MTTAAVVHDGRDRLAAAAVRWLPALGLVGGLAAIVGGRWWATTRGLDALAVGAAFGLALAALAVIRQPIRSRHGAVGRPARWVALAIGIGAGLALVGATLLGGALGAALGGISPVPGLGRPAASFVPWAAATILVASAEEAVLRGRLFDQIRRAGGLPAAVLVTTLAFALMHVPLYGWHVVPLDLAVGLGFAGLRIATRGVVAPAAAHAVADLATWWL